jgi:bifunctional UDP-N-acetylglucosamine pyrophosphorylase / glucosamine-1-phosphate N-acetyltransferase
MEQPMKAVVLGAGKATRMKSDRTKLVHRILGKEIINFLLDSLAECGIADRDIILVVGDNRAEIEAVVKRPVQYAVQEQQLGTAHALLAARDHIQDFAGELLVTVGDNPYITAAELQKLIAAHRSSRAQCTFLSAVFPHTPPPYGRIIRDQAGNVLDVVEEIDATPGQLAIREVNSSIYLFDNAVVFPRLFRIGNANAKSEYYLTDIIQILKNDAFTIAATPADDYMLSIGINNKWELQEAQACFNRRQMQVLAEQVGVTILQPESTTIEYGVEIGRDTVIYPCTYIGAGTRIGRHCSIGPFVYLRGEQVPDRAVVGPHTGAGS